MSPASDLLGIVLIQVPNNPLKRKKLEKTPKNKVKEGYILTDNWIYIIVYHWEVVLMC